MLRGRDARAPSPTRRSPPSCGGLVAEHLGKAFRPARVVFVARAAEDARAKIVRRAIRAAALGRGPRRPVEPGEPGRARGDGARARRGVLRERGLASGGGARPAPDVGRRERARAAALQPAEDLRPHPERGHRDHVARPPTLAIIARKAPAARRGSGAVADTGLGGRARQLFVDLSGGADLARSAGGRRSPCGPRPPRPRTRSREGSRRCGHRRCRSRPRSVHRRASRAPA